MNSMKAFRALGAALPVLAFLTPATPAAQLATDWKY
jgi:hypothetical protein